MKKLVWCLMCLILVLPACNQEDEFVKKEVSAETNLSPNRFYGVKYPDGEVQTKGIAQRGKLWYPGHTIKVKFLNGSADYQDKVKTYAAEWELYAGISFEYVTEGNADVRIGFDWNGDRYITWSYIGTDCKMVTDQSDATASFADWDWATETEKQGDVLRVFGQVLGLELEHRHLSFDPNWTNRIADYWEGEITDIPWDNLKEYVFDPLLSSDVIMTEEYDENSIMIWPFTRRYAGNTAREFNSALSELDKQFIARLYPKDDPNHNLLVTMCIPKEVHAYIFGNGPLLFDMGDNTQYETGPGDPLAFFHEYENEGKYQAKIYGAPDAITYFHLRIINRMQYDSISGIWIPISGTNYSINSLEIHNLPQLTELICSEFKMESINVINTPLLKRLFCSGNLFTSIDVKDKPSLQVFNCGNNKLTSLDVTQNMLLTHLNCDANKLTSLNVDNNSNLYELNCDFNQLTSLDVSNCPNIKRISLKGNPIVNDREALIQFAESLPTLNGYDDLAYLILDNDVSESWIQDICTSKNWPIRKERTF